MSESMAVATTIRDQIGTGALAMMGAKNLIGTRAGLSFKVGRNPKRVTHVRVTLDPTDTYTVEFLLVNDRASVTVKTLSELDGVYADMLLDVLKSGTGLEVRL